MGDENGHGGTPVSMRYGFVVDERAGPRSGPGGVLGRPTGPAHKPVMVRWSVVAGLPWAGVSVPTARLRLWETAGLAWFR